MFKALNKYKSIINNNLNTYFATITIVVLGVFLIINIIGNHTAKALPLLPKVYIGLGGLGGTGGLSGGTISVIDDNAELNGILKVKNSPDAESGYMLAVGVEPNLPVPGLSGLRTQFEFNQNFNQQFKGNSLGVGLYYNIIDLIPIVHPYVGASIMYYNAKAKPNISCKDNNIVFICDNEIFTAEKAKLEKFGRLSQPAAAFSIGLSATAPLIPLGVFAEYRYTTSALFPSNIKHQDDDIKIKGLSFQSSVFLVGLQYYVL